jgi:DNA-binding MarR family transcriptional regulator
MSRSQGNERRAHPRVDHVDSQGREGCLGEVLRRLERETPLWQDFLAAHRLIVDQMEERTQRDYQLPLPWFDVLIHLADRPGTRLRQRELRDRLLLSESGVSRLLVRMETAGLVTRSPSDEDRRGVEIALTEKGCAALTAATPALLDQVANLFTNKLTATDLAALQRVLNKLLADPETGAEQTD